MHIDNFAELTQAIRQINNESEAFIPLHAPVFKGHEQDYVLEAIKSTFVSSVGAYVNKFEEMLRDITGAKYAIACVNGTTALQLSLVLAGVKPEDLVITQSLSFVATANAITHACAEPIFLDVDDKDLGLCHEAVEDFLINHCELFSGGTLHKISKRRIAACVPMHTFGFPCQIDKLVELCKHYNIPVVEDAAEALGSYYQGQHCGIFGKLGTLSFNGNKVVTTGGGGAILTNDDELGKLGKHLSTTAKIPHAWEFRHDAVAYNYRMPNLNAALGCAQLEQLEHFLKVKRDKAIKYKNLFVESPWSFMDEPKNSQANFWLCAIMLNNRQERDEFLKYSNEQQVMTRPAWEPLHSLPMYQHCVVGDLKNTLYIADRLVNLPSGV